MGTVITNNRHYKDISDFIREKTNATAKFKPSELPAAICSMKNLTQAYAAITNGAVYRGSTVEMIGDKLTAGMFAGTEIDTVELKEGITEIPFCTFFHSAIKSIEIPHGVTIIDSCAFEGCSNLTSVTIPNTVTTIGAQTFKGCRFPGIVIPDSVTIIYNSTFALNYYLTSIKIPDNTVLDSNGGYLGMFSFCTNLETADFGCSVAEIPLYCFDYCYDLKTLILRRTESVCTTSSSYLDDTLIAKGTGYIYVPSALLEIYKTTSGWTNYAAQFRALEDYTVDGTTTGELDTSKI